MSTIQLSIAEVQTSPVIQARAESSLLKDLSEKDVQFAEFLATAKDLGTVTLEPDNESTNVTFDFKQAWHKRGERRQAALEASEAVLVSLANQTMPSDDERDAFYVRIGSHRVVDGRLPMMVEVTWPEAPAEQVAQLATHVMRQVAVDMRYPDNEKPTNQDRISDLVYAYLTREGGGELQTNPIGSCAIGTDGSFYYPEDPVLALGAHNIYSRDQQIICLAGGIAIAQADELLQQIA